MARKNESSQKAAMKEMRRDYLKNNDISIKSGTDVNSVMRDIMSILLEGTLDEELNEEPGYSKYDYGTRIRTTAATDIPGRPCIPAMVIWRLPFLVTVMLNMNRSLSKSTRISSHRTWTFQTALSATSQTKYFPS